jgi:pimeloyl-ACP methyl ester carboxylesterase
MVWQSKKYRDEARGPRARGAQLRPLELPGGCAAPDGGDVRQRRRTERTAQLDVPTLVIHGRDDSSSRPSGGFRTAELIPGAHLLFLADMGHDMPEPLWPLLVDASPRPHLAAPDAASPRPRSMAGPAAPSD